MSSGKVQILVRFLVSFIFCIWFTVMPKSTWWQGLVFWNSFQEMFISWNLRLFYTFLFLWWILVSPYYYYFKTFQSPFILALVDGFSLKWLQVSRTLLSILADLNNAVVWMVSTHPLTSMPSSPCTNPLVTAPSSPITIGISVTFMFHSFFSSLTQIILLNIHLLFAHCEVVTSIAI